MTAPAFSWPTHLRRHADYRLQLDGQPATALDTGCGAMMICEGTGPVTITIDACQRVKPCTNVDIKPHRLGITPQVADRRITIQLPGPMDILVEIPGSPDCFIFYGAPLDLPAADAPGVRYFAPGMIHEVGDLIVGPGETVVIPGGAVVTGSIRVIKGDGARICGRGIVDGSCWPHERNNFVSEHTNGVRLEGLTFINAASWTVKPCASSNVIIDGIRVVVHGNAHDGIDINGCQHVIVRNCFVRSDDDCVAIKSSHYAHPNLEARMDYCQNIDDVLVENCTLYSWSGGSALEIGHEFRCATVRNIVWRNIDVLAVHQYGSALSIRHCDGAIIENVLYEDIRVEHHYHAFIVFRIIQSRYSWSGHSERGRVRNVTLRRVHADLSQFNAGYTISDIGGWDADHGFDGLTFEQCTYGDTLIKNLDDFSCYTKHTTNIHFC